MISSGIKEVVIYFLVFLLLCWNEVDRFLFIIVYIVQLIKNFFFSRVLLIILFILLILDVFSIVNRLFVFFCIKLKLGGIFGLVVCIFNGLFLIRVDEFCVWVDCGKRV